LSPVKKYFDSGAKRTPIELWRPKVPQRSIMEQLGMSMATLKIKLRDFTAKNMVEWKRGIIELWTLRMSDSWWPRCPGG